MLKVRAGNNRQSSESGVWVASQWQCCPEGICVGLFGGGLMLIFCFKGKLHVVFYWSEAGYNRAKIWSLILTSNDAAVCFSSGVFVWFSKVFFELLVYVLSGTSSKARCFLLLNLDLWLIFNQTWSTKYLVLTVYGATCM